MQRAASRQLIQRDTGYLLDRCPIQRRRGQTNRKPICYRNHLCPGDHRPHGTGLLRHQHRAKTATHFEAVCALRLNFVTLAIAKPIYAIPQLTQQSQLKTSEGPLRGTVAERFDAFSIAYENFKLYKFVKK